MANGGIPGEGNVTISEKILWGWKFLLVLFIEQMPTEPPTIYQSLLELYQCLAVYCVSA